MTTRLVLVTGHTFGRRAFEGIFASLVYLDGLIEVPLMIGLPPERTTATVGYAPIDDLAREQGANFIAAADGTLLSLEETVREADPHYLLVIGWSRLVHRRVLAIPGGDGQQPRRAGCIGMHPTRLPLGRGQAPIPWTIIKGLESTALSVFFLEPAADTGPVIAQYELPVRDRETAASLFYRLAETHFTAGWELAASLAEREVTGRPQEAALATRWPKRRPVDGRIDHAMTYVEIERLVRALLGPYPRAFVSIAGRDYPVEAARLAWPSPETTGASHEQVSPRTIRFGCPDGIVELTRERGDRGGFAA